MNAFNKLARTNNTLILPSNVGDISSLVGQAMSIYKTIASSNNNNDNSSSNGPSDDIKFSSEQIDNYSEKVADDTEQKKNKALNKNVPETPKFE